MVSVESQSKVLGFITGREPEAIARSLAMMAYNPAIGRVLAKGGAKQFQDLMWETIPKLYSAQLERERFDVLHAELCQQIISTFKTSSQGALSYGQAQKPLNVFSRFTSIGPSSPRGNLRRRWLHSFTFRWTA